MLSILVRIASLGQITQNNKFAKFSQYLKKEVIDDVDFCTDKHLIFQQVFTIICDKHGQACLKNSKNKSITSLQYIKKVLSDEINF